MLGYYVVRSRFGCLLLTRKQDIPCGKTFSAEVLAWDACLPQQLLKRIFVQPHKPFSFYVGDNQREDSRRNFFYNFRDGQYLIAFKILGISAHPVFLVVVRSPLLAPPGCGAFLGRWYRAVLRFVCFVLCFSGDRQRRPICPY